MIGQIPQRLRVLLKREFEIFVHVMDVLQTIRVWQAGVSLKHLSLCVQCLVVFDTCCVEFGAKVGEAIHVGTAPGRTRRFIDSPLFP